MDSEKMFELADTLRALRDEKAEAEQRLKEINAAIDEADYRLSELMAETETQNFTRAGMMFCLTTKTRASATAGRKEEFHWQKQRFIWQQALKAIRPTMPSTMHWHWYAKPVICLFPYTCATLPPS